jgi:hypothetical protein
MKFRNIMLFTIVLVFSSINGWANPVIYTYSGPLFTDIYGNPPVDSADHITASITFSSPLQSNYEYFSSFVGIQSWTITDGHQQYSGSSTMPDWFELYLATGNDASQIEGWFFSASEDYTGQFMYTSTDFDYSEYSLDDSATTIEAGQWNMSTVPEPSGLILLSSGILGLGVTFLRKKSS